MLGHVGLSINKAAVTIFLTRMVRSNSNVLLYWTDATNTWLPIAWWTTVCFISWNVPIFINCWLYNNACQYFNIHYIVGTLQQVVQFCGTLSYTGRTKAIYTRVLNNNVIIVLRLPISQHHQHLLLGLDWKRFIEDSFFKLHYIRKNAVCQ